MKKLIVLLVVLAAIWSPVDAQIKRVLVANQTYYEAAKTTVKLITSDTVVVKRIIMGLSQYWNNTTTTAKNDRYGRYWMYTFTFPRMYCIQVIEFIKKLNRDQ